jgi:hypothetical protein
MLEESGVAYNHFVVPEGLGLIRHIATAYPVG